MPIEFHHDLPGHVLSRHAVKVLRSVCVYFIVFTLKVVIVHNCSTSWLMRRAAISQYFSSISMPMAFVTYNAIFVIVLITIS